MSIFRSRVNNPRLAPIKSPLILADDDEVFSPSRKGMTKSIIRANNPRPILIKSPRILQDDDELFSPSKKGLSKPRSIMSVKFTPRAPPSPIPHGVKSANSLAVPSPQRRFVTHDRPVQSKRAMRRPAELNLSEPPLIRPPGLWPVLSSVPESPAVSVGISLDVPSSVTSSSDSSEKSQGSSELSAAFWLSVSVEDAQDEEVGLATPLLFGRKDGSLWSPRLPKKSWANSNSISLSIFSPAAEGFANDINLESVTSPAPRDPIANFRSFTTALNAEKHFASMTSPAPNDRAAAFSSFSAALAHLGSDPVITFPPSVELKGERLNTR